MLERGGQMGTVGAERTREAREELLQMSWMDKWVAWPSVMWWRWREKERGTQAALRRETWQGWDIWH